MAQQKNSNVALCPECEGPVKLTGKLQVGQKLTCRRCGSTLVVVERRPLELVTATSSRAVDSGVKTAKKREKNNTGETEDSEHSLDVEMKMAPMSAVSMANCPECSTTLSFHRPLKERQLIVCSGCEETLEVISLQPLELSWANEDPWEFEEYDERRGRPRF